MKRTAATALSFNKKRKLELEPALPLDAILYIADALLLDIFKTCEFLPPNDTNLPLHTLLNLKTSCKLHRHALQHHLQQAKWITQGLHFLIKSQDLAGISFYCAYAAAHPKEAPLFLKRGHFYDNQLIYASCYGHTEVVKLLLEAGADVHSNNNQALHYASFCGYTNVVRLLLDRGANVHAEKDKALRWARERRKTEVVRLLLERGANVHGDDDEALQETSHDRRARVIKMVVDFRHNLCVPIR